MDDIRSRQVEYLLTEADVRQQVGKFLPDRFIKDYAAIKSNNSLSAQQIDKNTAEIELTKEQVLEIDGRLVIVEGEIVAIDARLTTAEGEIITLRTDLDNHIADISAHGATGNIVGTDDYAQASIGGTVLLADAVADAVKSTVAVTSPEASAAPAVYNQTQAQEVVTLANELKLDVNMLIANFNAAVDQLNALLASERTAKQLAP